MSMFSRCRRAVGGRPAVSNVADGGHQRPHHRRRWRSDVWGQSCRAKEETWEVNERERRDRGDERSWRIPSRRFVSRPILDCGHAAAGLPRLRKQEKSLAGEGQPDTRYVNTYYPGTYDALQASAVTLKAGDEMPVNFTAGAGENVSRSRNYSRHHRRPKTLSGIVPPRRAIPIGRMRMKSGRTASSKCAESLRDRMWCGHRPPPNRSRLRRTRMSA